MSNPQTAKATATAKALSLPEILEMIFTFVDNDTTSTWTFNKDYQYSRACFLFRCGLVNKLWNAEAPQTLGRTWQ
jgi:hypothetical protein